MYKKTDKKVSKKKSKEAAARSDIKNPVYLDIVNGIIDALEAGTDKWKMPWSKLTELGLPQNASTGNFYRGVNILWLTMQAQEAGYDRALWSTYKQWLELGAQVRAGERSAKVVFFKPVYKNGQKADEGETGDAASPEEKSEEIASFISVAYPVFNVLQVEGFEVPVELEHVVSKPDIQGFVANTGLKIVVGGTRACYHPGTDAIYMPALERFSEVDSEAAGEAGIAVLLHEMIHATGASHRLNRTFGKRFGDQAYAFEELVAELGATFLCADLGVTNTPRPSHAQYIASWIKVLKGDPKALFTAARLAQQAVDYLHGLQSLPAAELPANAIMPISNVGR